MRRGDVIAERFLVEDLVAAGGSSEVFRAADRATGGLVALKRLSGPQRARFDLEARVLAQLDHPAVVRYVAHGETPRGEAWLAMEWLEGEALSARLARGAFSVADTVALGLGVADALGAAHARGIIHRDIKPDNLFLVGGDPAEVKLLDFGIVRVGRLPRETGAGVVLGTLGYMAPEQARAAAALDARADVYALGCVLLECLRGAPVFAADDLLGLLAKIVIDAAPRAGLSRADVPEALDDLLARMTQKDPALRPRDGAAVAAELAEVAAGLGAPRARSAAPRPELTGRERRTAFVVLVGPGERAESFEVLRAAVEARHGALSEIVGGSLAAAISGVGVAEDRAALAAECAMALHTLLPGRTVALAAGRGEAPADRPAAEAVDRAVRLLRAPRGGAPPAEGVVVVDELAAALLERRFELVEGPAGMELLGERPEAMVTPTLLGRPTPCVGRARELEALVALFERCAAEPSARAALLTAPAGLGKSRLADELLRRLDGRAQIWVGRGDPSSAGSSFSVLGTALRHAAGVRGGDPIELRREKLRALSARAVPERDRARVAAFLGEIVGAPFPEDATAELAAARRDPAMMGDQIRRAWVDLCRAECAWQNLVLVLDDLHWGDLPTLSLVGAALDELAQRPFLVLGLGRPEVIDLFGRVGAARELTELRLGGIPPEACGELVRAALGEGVDPAVCARLAEGCEGHPLYLEELIRAAARPAAPTSLRGDDADPLRAPPETVLAMVETRLAHLSSGARRALRAASVFGEVFWTAAVGALLGDPAEAPLRLAELEAEELVVRRGGARFAGEEEWAARHALVREAAYATLTDDDRRLGHQLAGEWLEAAGETDAVVLAAHFEGGLDPARAVGWYVRAAQQALEGDDLGAVLARAERGLACGAQGEARGALLLHRAAARRLRGGSGADAAPALSLLAPGSPLWFGAAREVILGAEGEALRAVVAEVRAAPRDEGIAAAQLGALAAAYARLSALGWDDEAAAIFPAIDAFAELGAARDPAASAAIHEARAQRALGAGDAGLFLREAEAARGASERAGDRRGAAALRLALGRVLGRTGETEQAEPALRAALAEASGLGLALTAHRARAQLGVVLARLGKLEEARSVAGEAVERARGSAAEGEARAALAGVLLALGEDGAPERQARLAVELGAHDRAARAEALVTLAEVLLADRRAREALEAGRAALDLEGPRGSLLGVEGRARLVLVEAHHALGAPAASRAALIEARARLLARAQAIRDPARRSGFLERVPENARVLDLARLVGLPVHVEATTATSLRREAQRAYEGEAVESLREAQHALARGNLDAAVARAELGMNHVATSEVRAELRATIARAHGFRNAWTTARRWAEQGMRESAPGGPGWFAAFAARVLAAAELGEPSEIEGAADVLARLEAPKGAPIPALVAASALGVALSSAFDHERLEITFDWLERLGAEPAARRAAFAAPGASGPTSAGAELAREPLVRGWTSRARAARARAFEQDPWTALRFDEAARAAFAEAGDGGEAALSLAHVGADRALLGSFERAAEALYAARAAAGQRAYLAALATVHLAHALADAGRLGEAGAEILEGVKADRCRHNPALRAAQGAALAEVLRRRGELASAAREAEAALSVAEGGGLLLRTATLATLAAVRLGQGRAGEALDLARRARSEREARRAFGHRDAFVRLVHVECLLGVGDVAGARAPLTRAHARLSMQAAKIGDPALRASFLERVPENARTASLSRQWLGEGSDLAARW